MLLWRRTGGFKAFLQPDVKSSRRFKPVEEGPHEYCGIEPVTYRTRDGRPSCRRTLQCCVQCCGRTLCTVLQTNAIYSAADERYSGHIHEAGSKYIERCFVLSCPELGTLNTDKILSYYKIINQYAGLSLLFKLLPADHDC